MELKAYHCNEWHNEYTEFYLKSEADKVVDELKVKLRVQTSNAEDAWKLKDSYRSSCAKAVNELYEKNKELRHHKYKRCLGLAAVCFEKSYSTTLLKYDKKSDLFRNFYDWWGNRWLELAEKFKEAK